MAASGAGGAAGFPAVRPRLVAVDVDGTLLDSRHVLTSATIEAVRRARASGVHVVVASSRPPRGLHAILDRLGLVGSRAASSTPFIASHGALTGVYGPSGNLAVLDQRPMQIDAAREVLARVPAGVAVNWYAGERWLVAALDDLVRREAQIVGFEPEVVDLAVQAVGPDKLLLLASPEQSGVLRTMVAPAGLTATPSTPTHLEVTRSDVDKGSALARLCARLGIAPQEVVAIGDGRNDLPMLAFAGTAVAPANAVPEVLAVADLITASNDADAVAAALAALLG